MRRLLVAAAIVLTLSWSAAPAGAHTDLVSISPSDGSRVTAWPTQATLVFTEAIDPSLSSVSVSIDGQDGALVPLGRGDGESEVVADLRSLQPDESVDTTSAHRVVVSYRVTSADGHPIAGSSTFTLGAKQAPLGVAGDGTEGAAQDRTDEAGPTAAVPTTDSVPSSAPPVVMWLLAGLLAIVVVVSLLAVRRMRSMDSATRKAER